MKQIFQSVKDGHTEILDVPCPQVIPGHLLIRTGLSLISLGTERMLVEFGKAGYLNKARQQPDKIRMVLDKIKTDGLIPTLEAVKGKLDQPVPMGYCNVGTVLEVGDGVADFQIGDRVVSNGAHAEVVRVPKNLCAKVPSSVTDEDAVFTVQFAIALHGVRLAGPMLGESFAVIGLGLIGLLTVQILRAQGCRVLGVDLDRSRLDLAKAFGAQTLDLGAGEDPISAASAFTGGAGADGVIITASTKSNEPVHQAALMSRKKGRIVLVGVVGLELSRSDFYEKELSFQVSCSYGPGRYDPSYEIGGQDYPRGYVRWTAQRNFEAVLTMMEEDRLNIQPLISHRIPLAEAHKAYHGVKADEHPLGIVLEYPEAIQMPDNQLREYTVALGGESPPRGTAGSPVIGLIGGGQYADRILIPALKQTGVSLKTVASSGGASGTVTGRKHRFGESTTDPDSLLADPDINVVVIATRHDSHARFVCQAIRAGNHVFVEKPLAVTYEELSEIESVCTTSDAANLLLMVGFNRRFSPLVQEIMLLLNSVHEPKSFIFTINAGELPKDHWQQDAASGGRIVGEACHFVDLMRYLAGCPITELQAVSMRNPGEADVSDDKVSFTLRFSDGSIGTVHYLANGHRTFPKERLEIFCGGRILQLDNFRKLTGYGWSGFRKRKLWRQDKGHHAAIGEFIDAVRTGAPAPIPLEQLVEITRVTLDVARVAKAS